MSSENIEKADLIGEYMGKNYIFGETKYISRIVQEINKEVIRSKGDKKNEK